MKKLFTTITISIMLIAAILMFAGCDGTLTFAKMTKFDVEDVQLIKIKSEYGVVKEISKDFDKVLNIFSATIFSKTEEARYESNWDIDRKMTVDFYLSGKDGYYSIVLDTGTRAMDGYKGKSETGFYNINNLEDVLIALNKIFYQS